MAAEDTGAPGMKVKTEQAHVFSLKTSVRGLLTLVS